MANKFLRTDVVLENCEEHLRATDTAGTEIESYLTQYALIVFYTDIERELEALIAARIEMSSDVALEGFVNWAYKRLLRSVKTSEIADLLHYFGADVKERFRARVSPEDAQAYNNAIVGRHTVAHASGVNITFSELKIAVDAGRRVLEVFAEELLREEA